MCFFFFDECTVNLENKGKCNNFGRDQTCFYFSNGTRRVTKIQSLQYVCGLVFRSHNAMAAKGQDMDVQSNCPSGRGQDGFLE